MKATPKHIPESIGFSDSVKKAAGWKRNWVVVNGEMFWTGDGWHWDEERALLFYDEINAHATAKRVGGKVD